MTIFGDAWAHLLMMLQRVCKFRPKIARLPGFHSLCVRIELGGGCGLCCVMPGPKGKECVAFGCTEYAQSSSYSFHVFPKDPKRRKEWALKVKRKGHDGKLWMPGQHDCLCSKHFEEEDFTTRTQLQRQGVLPSHIKFAAQLKPDAVPSLFSYNEKTKQKHQDSANKLLVWQRNAATESSWRWVYFSKR